MYSLDVSTEGYTSGEARVFICFQGVPLETDPINGQARWQNVEHVAWVTNTSVDWFNNRRIHNEIGKVPPKELRAN
jgi:hypothetical protein